MKSSFFIFLLLIGFLVDAYAQQPLIFHKLSLQIVRFHTRIGGAYRKDSVWAIKEAINLPSQPTFISVTVQDTDKNPRLICILSEAIKIYDTIQVGPNNTVNFFNLTGGNYDLTFINQTNHHQASVQFTIEYSFWEQWWFIPFVFIVITLLLALIFYFLYLIRLRQQLRLLSVRENIARDLHDDMGSYLSSISMLSQSVLNIAQKDPKHARLLVDKIGETARQVMDSMSDIIWSVNPENDSMSQIVVRMRDVANDLLGDQDSSLHMTIDDAVSQAHLPLEQRRDFFLIYKEALTNIAKYASASHVWIRLQRSGPTLVLTMQDDGVGFDISQSVGRNPLGGNGLKNIRSRAEKLGGTLTIQSEPGQGTVITLQISVA